MDQSTSNTGTLSEADDGEPKEKRQKTLPSIVSKIVKFGKGGSKEKETTKALLFMIVKDNMPLSTVENEGFKYFVRKTIPLYKLPSRKTLTHYLDQQYEYLSGVFKKKLQMVENLSLTTDCWTETLNTTSFLSLTCHFVDPDLNIMKSHIIGVF